MKRLSILLLCAICAAISSFAQVPIYSVYEDCSRNGYATGIAPAPADVQMVDLGLSVKWASCNVGATAPEEYGNYYAWGEVLPKDDYSDYSWETYKHCNGTSSSMTKYCTNSSYGTVDNKTTLEAMDDAAAYNWGGTWRMPTEAEWQELKEGCTLTITTLNGVYGYEIKSSINGNTIFLPAAGYFRSRSNTYEGSRGSYWSSSLSESDNTYAWDCYLNTGRTIRTDIRNTGRSVRPVCLAGSSTNSAAHHTLTLYADGCGNANTIVLPQGTQAKIQAVPEDFHHFVQWSDGNTDNPRTVRLTQDITLTAEFGLAYSGMCGDNLYWEYNDKVLTITGSGEMYDYAYNIYESEDVEIMPWLYLRDSIYSVILPNGITYIGNWAFNGCYNLRNITCLAVTPPTCGSNAFNDVPYDATLWCPCESKEAYQSADGWSRFYDIRRINFPQTTLLTDSEKGRVQIDEWICEPQSVVISATPYEGYAFTRWSDGNTDNPRTVRLTQDTTLTAEFGLAYSGMCGDNLYWEYSSGNLQITGSGIMYDYTKSTMPWLHLRDSIYSVTLPQGITCIGAYAFCGCSSLNSITIPNSLTGKIVDSLNPNAVYFVNMTGWSDIHVYAWIDIEGSVSENASWPGEIATKADFTYQGYDVYYFTASPGDYAYCIFNNGVVGIGGDKTENLIWTGGQAYFNNKWHTIQIEPYYDVAVGTGAFNGCSSLRDITCLAVTPPTCGSNAFDNVPDNATLWCPCESKEAYQSADGWSRFNDIRRINFPQTTLLTDSERGRAQIDEWICESQSVVISATPNFGYAFTRWSDGNTDNPRTVRLTQDTTLTAEFGLAYSGMCGDNLYWEYSSGNLQITGSGIMYDYTKSTMPWLYLRDSIYSVILPNGITYIGNWAFNSCYNLRDITCLAVTPPTCGSNAFNNVPYDATLWCPCEGKEAYQSADGWSQFNDIRRIDFPQTTLLTDSERGRAQIDEWICESQSVVISAIPNFGYAFTRWSDGNTDNPRTVLLTQDTTLTAEFGLAYSGMCGDNLYWEYKNKKLSITGSGEMYDGTPWFRLCDSIYSVSLPNGITSIGNRAFSGCYNLVSITIPNTVTYIGNRAFADCIALTSITLPNSLTSIAYRTFSGCTALASVTIPSSVTFIEEYAFEECRKLRDIYCYAATPPTAQTNSFANYNVYVHVPCASLDAYDMDAVFGSFKYVECIGSEDADIKDKTVTIVPGNADATFTWPITDGAETYTLVITKDGVTFCTLVFNAQGQLVSIAFKPARQNAPASEGTTPANYAEQTANGFRFTVTNLSEGTAYAYTLTVRNAANSILATYTGEFTTQSDIPMGIHESAGDNTPAGQAEKILQNGQVLILRNGVTYDMMGQQL